MITGYNTDVRHRLGIVHVQTEDKGLSNPVIESLIYVGGRVVTSKRSSYQEAVSEIEGEGELETRVVELMDRQHRVMMAAIRRGDFDEQLGKMLGPVAKARTGQREEAKVGPPQLPKSVAKESAVVGPQGALIDAKTDRTLDQVILDYLDSEAERQQLDLEMTFETAPGQPARGHIAFRAFAASSKLPVSEVSIEVRLISTDSAPVSLGAGQTDARGCLDLDVALPNLSSGRTALIARASSTIGDAEIKQIL